jgi:type I restriction enzyme, S subunit
VSAKDLKGDRIEATALHVTKEAIACSSTKVALSGSLLILVRGMGLANGIQIAELARPCAFNQDIRALTPVKGVHDRYLRLAIRWSYARRPDLVTKAAHGTLKIDADKLRNLSIPLPPVAEQKRIVAILDEAFAAIDQATANTQQNLTNARELFESALESLLRSTQANWSKASMSDSAKADCTLSYGIVQPGEEWPDGIPVVRPTDLTHKTIRLNGLKRIAPQRAESYTRTTLVGGEILLCVRGTTGTVSVASEELCGGNVTRGIVPIRFDETRVMQDFGYYLLRSPYVQTQIREATYGTALMQINIRDVRKLRLAYPSLTEQALIVRASDDVSDACQRLESSYRCKLQHLSDLKQSILQQAFRGELTAATAEAVIASS